MESCLGGPRVGGRVATQHSLVANRSTHSIRHTGIQLAVQKLRLEFVRHTLGTRRNRIAMNNISKRFDKLTVKVSIQLLEYVSSFWYVVSWNVHVLLLPNKQEKDEPIIVLDKKNQAIYKNFHPMLWWLVTNRKSEATIFVVACLDFKQFEWPKSSNIVFPSAAETPELPSQPEGSATGCKDGRDEMPAGRM